MAWRHHSGGLLYRARSGQEPPRRRPVVLVLDVSPPVFGPIEALTRPAAHAVATTLRAAGRPVALVTAGGPGTARRLDAPAALLSLLTERTLRPADAARTMTAADTLRGALSGSGAEPVVLLLSQVWFGAEERDAPAPAGLRGLFVQDPGPGRPVRPAWAERCARFETLAPTDPPACPPTSDG